MEDFRQQFTLEAVAKLKHLSANLKDSETTSESFNREIFRTLHTIKGTAQTFGFAASSFLAHELENLLAARESSGILFREGSEILIESLQHKDFEIPKSFLEKVGIVNSDGVQTNHDSGTFAPETPDEFFSQLSNQEKIALRSATRENKNLFCLEIGFALSEFADGLVNFREILNASGEIIATLPSAKFNADGKIGFQILYASSVETAEVRLITERNGAEVIFDSLQNASTTNFRSVAAHAVRHGRETAEKYGKQIDFAVAADETELSADELKIVFDALLHLVRNAVDHGIEASGEIKISLEVEESNLHLTVSDDGNGIDLSAVKARATAKNLLSADTILNERETIDLIFLPEFSTKSIVTETSGRGIGLDAVKMAITEVGGTINATSERGKGTTFEIVLPRRPNQRTKV